MVSKPWKVSSPTGRHPGEHVCWPFRRDTDLLAVAQAYMMEGLARQERVVYLGAGGPDELQHDLGSVPALHDGLDRGRLLLVPSSTSHASSSSIDPAEVLRVVTAMTEDALAAGYPSLRVFVQGTRRVRDAERRAQHVRYEHLIDRFCLKHPITVLCAYDAAVLGNSAVAELVCVHALAHDELSPFQVHAAPSADAAVCGNVDVFCADQLEQALQRIGVAASGGTVVIDATNLEFIDVRGLLTLDRHAAASDAVMVLRSPSSILTRLSKLVDFIALQVEGSA
jgi:hypothetical protein